MFIFVNFYEAKRGYDSAYRHVAMRSLSKHGFIQKKIESSAYANTLNPHWRLIDSSKSDRLPFIECDDKKIVIHATEENASPSNLMKVATVLGMKTVRELMKSFRKQNFIIGPRNHPYYSQKKVDPKKYETMQLVLYHPDIHPGYEPPTRDTSSMRKLFLHLVKKPLSQQDSKISSSEAIDTTPAARGKIKDNAAISTAMTNDHASVDVVAATNPENAVVQDNSWIVTNIAEV